MKKKNLSSAFLLTLLAGLAGAASCKVDKSGLTFDDDAYDELRNGGGDGDGDTGGDGDGDTGGTSGDGDGDMGGDGSGGNSLGGMGGSGGETGPEPGDTRCDGKQVEFFVGGELWVPLGAACEFLCTDGECGGNCAPDATECLSEIEGRICDATGNWESDPCEFACVGDACGGECVPGHRQCSGSQRELCSEFGSWESEGDPCPDTCEDSGDGASASCVGSCTNDETQCTGVTSWELCVTNNWEPQPDCEFVCLDGACGGTCEPNTSTCSGSNERITCSSQGEPGLPVQCDGQTCVDGQCEGVCEPGQEACFQGNIYMCVSGAWELDLDCEKLGAEYGLDLSCRGVGEVGKPVLVCGECPYGDGETPVTRCHTTKNHGTAAESCKLDLEKRVTSWSIDKEDCAACFQGSCDVVPEELCKDGNAKGCYNYENSWYCDGGRLFERPCEVDGSGNPQYCEIIACSSMPNPPNH